jgi:putative ABC transport system permease protein
MRYALLTIWHDKRRYLGGVLAVAISNVLICLMVGLLLGLFGLVSLPVDLSGADVWVTGKDVPSCDLASVITRDWENYLRMQPGVTATDEFIQTYGVWQKEGLGSSMIVVLGVNVGPSSLGPVRQLSQEQRALLSEEGAVVVDRGDLPRLGVKGVDDTAEIAGRQVRVVSLTEGMGSLSGPYVFCSLQTARTLYDLRPDQTTYVLARCRAQADLPGVMAGMDASGKVSTHSQEEFSSMSRSFWLRTSKAGLGVGFMALVSLAFGALVTSQSLYSATVSSIKELALLRALGTSKRRLRRYVMEQAVLVGGFGVLVGVPASYAVAFLARSMGVRAITPAWLIGLALLLNLSVALLAGLWALRSLRHAEPIQLLR